MELTWSQSDLSPKYKDLKKTYLTFGLKLKGPKSQYFLLHCVLGRYAESKRLALDIVL